MKMHSFLCAALVFAAGACFAQDVCGTPPCVTANNVFAAGACFAQDVPDFQNENLPAPVVDKPEYNHNDALYNNGNWESTRSWESLAQEDEIRSVQAILTARRPLHAPRIKLLREDAAILSRGVNAAEFAQKDHYFGSVSAVHSAAMALFPGDQGSRVGAARYGKGAYVLMGSRGVLAPALASGKGAWRTLINNVLAWQEIQSDTMPILYQSAVPELDEGALERQNFKQELNLDSCRVLFIESAEVLQNPKFSPEKLLPWMQNGGVLFLSEMPWALNQVMQENMHTLSRATGLYLIESMRGVEPDAVTAYPELAPYTNAEYFNAAGNEMRFEASLQYAACKNIAQGLEMACAARDTLAVSIMATHALSVPLIAVTQREVLDARREPLRALYARMQGTVLKIWNFPLAHPSVVDWPGTVAPEAPRIARTLDIPLQTPPNAFGHAHAYLPTWKMTGLYAVAGQKVLVEIPESATQKGLFVQVGHHVDINYDWHDRYERFPDICKARPLTQTQTEIISNFGGLVFILVPPGMPEETISVTISGAVAAPFYVYPETSDARWKERSAHAQGAWGYIQTPTLIVYAQANHLRAVADIHKVAAHWWRVQKAFDYLSGVGNARMRPEMVTSDRQIIVGYGHSGYPAVMAYNQANTLVSDEMLRHGDWGFYHELGHSAQFAVNNKMRLAEHPEIDVNTYALFAMELFHGKGQPLNYISPHPTADRDQLARDWEKFSQLPITERHFSRSEKRGNIEYLFYWELKSAFGWSVLAQAARAICEDPANKLSSSTVGLSDQARFLKLLCLACQRNLIPYYESFGLSHFIEQLRDDPQLTALPAWDGNHAPVFTACPARLEIEENAPAGTILHTFKADDAENAQTVYYRILSGNEDNHFELDAQTGELRVAAAPNYESKPQYTLDVEAFDTAFIPKGDRRKVIIDVQNVRENGAVHPTNLVWFKRIKMGDQIGTVDFEVDSGCTFEMRASWNDFIRVDTHNGAVYVRPYLMPGKAVMPAVIELNIYLTQIRNGVREEEIQSKLRVYPDGENGVYLIREVPNAKTAAEKVTLEHRSETNGVIANKDAPLLQTLFIVPQDGVYAFELNSNCAESFRCECPGTPPLALEPVNPRTPSILRTQRAYFAKGESIVLRAKLNPAAADKPSFRLNYYFNTEKTARPMRGAVYPGMRNAAFLPAKINNL